MISILTIPLALAVPMLEGVLLLRLLESRTPVLFRFERLCTGFFLGLSGSAFVLFFGVFSGLPLTLGGFLSVHCALITLLLFLSLRHFPRLSFAPSPLLPSDRSLRSLPRLALFLGAAIIFWTLLKIGAGTYDLLSVPAYYDDTYANWNMRAKAFFASESLLLHLPRTQEMYFGGRVPSYPLTIYFTKVWLAQVYGGWSEPIVNSVHIVWFLGLLALLFFALRRETSVPWALLGVYVLASLPLVLMHGTNPYSDVAMSAYLFLPLLYLEQWKKEADPLRQRTWLLLLSTAAAAMLFVKSEAILLFLPPLSLLFLWFWYKKERLGAGSWKTLATYVGIVSLVAVPWVLFKIFHGLEFGNAQSVSGFTLTLNAGVAGAIFNDLFYTGSYLLFFPMFLLTFTLTRDRRKNDALPVVLLFLCVVFLGQLLLYMFTPLGPEAIRHTGFGRGMVQLLPSCVFVAVRLLSVLFAPVSSSIARKQWSKGTIES